MSNPKGSVLIEHKLHFQTLVELKRAACEITHDGKATAVTLGIDITSSFIPWYAGILKESLAVLSHQGAAMKLNVYFIDGNERKDPAFAHPNHIGIGVNGKIELQRITGMSRSSHHASERKLKPETLRENYSDFARALSGRYPAYKAEFEEFNDKVIAVLIDAAERSGRETVFGMQAEIGRRIVEGLRIQYKGVEVAYFENMWDPIAKSAKHGMPHGEESFVFIPAQEDGGQHMAEQAIEGVEQKKLMPNKTKFVMLAPGTDFSVPLPNVMREIMRLS
jgi:hypothetical protein